MQPFREEERTGVGARAFVVVVDLGVAERRQEEIRRAPEVSARLVPERGYFPEKAFAFMPASSSTSPAITPAAAGSSSRSFTKASLLG